MLDRISNKTEMIRCAKSSDLNVIMDIWLKANKTAHDFIEPDYWEQHYHEVELAIANAEVYVYDDDKTIKGFAGLYEQYIAGIFVRQEYQSTGIGSKLMHFLQNAKPELTLNVYVGNKKALKFYQKHGFMIVQEQIEPDTKQPEYFMKWQR